MPLQAAAVHFSPTSQTKRIADYLTAQIADGAPIGCDITDSTPHAVPEADVAVIAVPVFGGRVPSLAAERLRTFSGNGQKAVAVTVYGNRHYDDALLELCELLQERNFQLVAAGAFIARHSIIPEIAAGRPNADDFADLDRFAAQIRERLSEPQPTLLDIQAIPGKHPYKEKKSGGYPITVSRFCKDCKTCALLCPVSAISETDVSSTDASKCFGCMRCIHLCPQHARALAPETYHRLNTVLHQFEAPRPNEMFL